MGPSVAWLRPPLWGGEDAAAGLPPALADYHAWRRQALRAARLEDELARKRARAGLRDARRAAASFLDRPLLRRAWEAVEYTEEYLVHERVGAADPHDPSLCYLCDPGATIGVALPLAIAYATAALFQVENGEEADAEFLADWNELRRARGVRAVPAETLATSREARDDLRAFLAWEIEGVCLEYPLPHVRRWGATPRPDGAGRAGIGRDPGSAADDPSRSRAALDALVARVTADAERYWLFGNTWRNGFSSTRLKTPFTT